MEELRDIALTEAAKVKHFFLENDIKGPALKRKAILTVSVPLLQAFRIAKPCIVKEVKWPVG